MDNFENLTKYHLKARVYLIDTGFGGRSGPISDGYRGQFFWHINDVSTTDWDACYFFENGEVYPGKSSICKILVSDNLLKCSGGRFSKGRQFSIREGSTVIAVGIIESNKAKNA